MKKVIWFGNSFYGSPYKVGTNYYSEEFAKQGWEVHFINPPITPFHFLFSKINKERKEELEKGSHHSPFHNYHVYNIYSLVPPVGGSGLVQNFIINYWLIFSTLFLMIIANKRKWLDADLVVIDHVFGGAFIKIFSVKRWIYRVTDNLKGFKVSPELVRYEIDLMKKAHLVISTSMNVSKDLEDYGIASFVLPNGVDVDKFNCRSVDVENVVIYVGAIDFWFNYKALYISAVNSPEITFKIYGEIKYRNEYFEKICLLSNVNFCGLVKNELVPRILSNAKVGIIPFDTSLELTHSISPLKLYEYLAAGLNVVSFKWNEILFSSEVASLVETEDEFSNAIKENIKKSVNLEGMNIAALNSWKNKAIQIMNEVKRI